MNRGQLLKRLSSAWEELLESYAGLSEAEMLEPGLTGNWSVKDIIAHISWWEEEALKYLPLILEGGTPPRYSITYGGIDAFNAQMTQVKHSLSISEILNQRDETHQRLLDYLQLAPEDQIAAETRFRRRLRLDTYHHYAEHTEMIWHWRNQRPVG